MNSLLSSLDQPQCPHLCASQPSHLHDQIVQIHNSPPPWRSWMWGIETKRSRLTGLSCPCVSTLFFNISVWVHDFACYVVWLNKVLLNKKLRNINTSLSHILWRFLIQFVSNPRISFCSCDFITWSFIFSLLIYLISINLIKQRRVRKKIKIGDMPWHVWRLLFGDFLRLNFKNKFIFF